MATPYTDVYDFFMLQIEDYSLMELYEISEMDFQTVLQGFMLLAIEDFVHVCSQDLTDRDDVNFTFNIDLSEEHQVILSKLMVKHWLKKEVQDVLQMNWNLTDRDYRIP